MTSQIYHLLQDAQSRVPKDLGPFLVQEPVYLEDALGRLLPLTLGLINSRHDLEYVLVWKFKDQPGQNKVIRREYIFQGQNGNQDIEDSRQFHSWFCPGTRLYMSMIFKENGNDDRNSCPGCGLKTFAPLHSKTQWHVPRHSNPQNVTPNTNNIIIRSTKCGIWFQRVEEIDGGTSTVERLDAITSHTPEPSNTKLRSRNPNSDKRGHYALEDADTDIRAFKRVQLHHPRIYSQQMDMELQEGDEDDGPSYQPPLVPDGWKAIWHKGIQDFQFLELATNRLHSELPSEQVSRIPWPVSYTPGLDAPSLYMDWEPGGLVTDVFFQYEDYWEDELEIREELREWRDQGL